VGPRRRWGRHPARRRRPGADPGRQWPRVRPAPSTGSKATEATPAPSASPRRKLAAAELRGGDTDRPEVRPKTYGALQCTDYEWKLGHPALAKTCYATGPGIRIAGHLASTEGVQADVSVLLRDAATGQTVAGPYTCNDQAFSETVKERSCGPFEVKPRTGRRYKVVQTWRYEGRASSLSGTVTGPEFRY
jgi:hypothetical protein